MADRPSLARPLLLLVALATLLGVAPTSASAATPSNERRLHLRRVIGGAIAPKSVVATGTGEVWAQNEVYRHTVTVYGPRGSLLATIPDRIRLSRWGYPRWDEPVRG